MVLLLASCSSKEQMEAAHVAIRHFRELMAAKKFDQIYAEASDQLKSSPQSADLPKLLAVVDRKLGAVKSSEDKGQSVNFSTGGTFVALTVQTQYEKGSAFETFQFSFQNGKAVLNGYKIQSQELIFN
jgi:hypothetical protein